MDLTKWVKPKVKPKRRKLSGVMIRFLVDFPEGIMTPNGSVGPFKAGDLVNIELLGEEVAKVLLLHDCAGVYVMEGS